MTHVLDAPYGAPRPRPMPRQTLVAPQSLLIGALAAGLLAAATLPGMRSHGLGLLLVVIAVAAVVVRQLRGWLNAAAITYGVLGLALAGSALWRDASWVVAINYLAAIGLSVLCVTGGRTWSQLGRAVLASVPAGLRAPAFLARPLLAQTRRMQGTQFAPILRGAAMAAALTTIFAILFTTADQAFSQIVSELAGPTVDLDLLPIRLFLLGVVASATAALVLLRQSVSHGPQVRPRERVAMSRIEWVLPLGALVALFLAFVGVQLAVLYGGRTHVLSTAGLTYAEYAREGFFQLLVVALLVLGVIAAAARLVPQSRAADRLLLRGLLGALCVLTVVVLVSAMTRLDTYVDAYGLTRLRVLVDTFLRWLAVVFGLVVVAGVRRRAPWLPQAVVASAAAALLVLTASNPDARIARAGLARAERTGTLDTGYLAGLSGDAVPVLAASGEPVVRCLAAEAVAQAEADDSWLELNLARVQARRLSSRIEGCPPTR